MMTKIVYLNSEIPSAESLYIGGFVPMTTTEYTVIWKKLAVRDLLSFRLPERKFLLTE